MAIKSRRCAGQGMWHAWRTIESRAGFWCGHLKGKATWEIKGSDGAIILKYALHKQDGRAWIEVIWLRIGTGDGLL